MLLLAVDTAGSTGGVLLARQGAESPDRLAEQRSIQILGARDLPPRAFSAQLIPAIAELLQSSQLLLADLDALVVVSGPGSFTGLRVGLSAVKAMAEATGKAIIALSRLAVLASMAATLSSPESADALVHAVLDAGRGEFYHGIYRDSGKICVAESLQTLDGLTAAIHNPSDIVLVSEPAVHRALAAINGIDGMDVRELPPPAVQDALPLAAAAWQAGDFRNPATLDANYLRRSDAIVATKLPGSTLPAQRPGCGS